MSYQLGQPVRIRGDFVSRATGLPTDPTTVTVKVYAPSGAVTTPTAVNDAAVVGGWYYDLTVDETGTWADQWTGTGDVQAVSPDGTFEVIGSIFDDEDAEVPWITLTAARALTGNFAITKPKLQAAAQEIYDEMRWTPEYGVDLVTESYSGDLLKATALGRAIAWQASYRQLTSATPSDGQSVLITSESFDIYSVGYGGQSGKSGVRSGGAIAERALKILRQNGLYNMTGISGQHPRYRYLVANAADVLSDP